MVDANVIFNTQMTSSGSEKVNADMTKLQKSIVNMSRLMSKNMRQGFEKLENQQKEMNKTNKIAAASTEKYRNSMMGLRRAMIAFFFVTRQLGQLLSPAAELVGIFDIWNTIVTVTFLPAMIWLLEKVFIPMLDWFLKIPEPVQLFIGLITTLGVVLGTLNILAVLSGLGNLTTAFGKVKDSIGTANGGFSAFQKLAIAGIAIKAVFDLEAYLSGQKDLEETIKAFGDSLALFGLVSGKPWIIAIGLLPRLLPMGESLADKGKELIKSGTETTTESGRVTPGGLLKMLGGSIIAGAGTLLQYGQNAVSSEEITTKSVPTGSAEYYDVMAKQAAAKRRLNVKDAIIRPGQPPINIDPNDTLIAGKNPRGGTLGAMGGVTINQTVNINASNKDEFMRLINDNNKKLVDDITRRVGA